MPASSDGGVWTYTGFDDELIEALDTAFGKLEEARELLLYAEGLIDNTTERERVNFVGVFIQKAKRAYLQVLFAWDRSPVLRKVREEHDKQAHARAEEEGRRAGKLEVCAQGGAPGEGSGEPGVAGSPVPGAKERGGRRDLE